MRAASSISGSLRKKYVVPFGTCAWTAAGDRRVRMAKQGGAGTEVVIDVFAAGDVPDAASGAACDDQVQLGRQHEQPESRRRRGKRPASRNRSFWFSMQEL
jgi:hypothetical protein